MSIADQITRLSNAKAAIKTSIENKGVTVGDDVKLDAYPALIDSIESGGGSGETHVNPDFYDIRTQNGTNYNYLFYEYTGNSINLSKLDNSKVTTMSYMFYNCKSLSSLNLSSFYTSNVTNMSYMFYYCTSLTSLDLSSFDTSKVTNIQSMFNYCTSLSSLNLSSFDTSKVTTMYFMFYYCSNLTSLDLSSFDTSKVTNMSYMFNNCNKLTTVVGYLDLSNLTNGFFESKYNNPIYGCSKLETLYLKNIYKNCTMTNASKWSIDLSPTKIKDECLIYIINELPNLYDKGLTATDQITFTLSLNNTLTAEQVQPAIDKGWQVANVNY